MKKKKRKKNYLVVRMNIRDKEIDAVGWGRSRYFLLLAQKSKQGFMK